ncbi:hypothetical protein [Allofrancisella guangzhouensis]|uniref:hypothetical protein n=1 Tax=Allofrancisella guangzhouensis TaxID=594679 RepID=UPI002D7FD84C|nr:hypothetical protein [Allofrancisella guangzhouensis]
MLLPMSQNFNVAIKITETGAELAGKSIRNMSIRVTQATKAMAGLTAALGAVAGGAAKIVGDFAKTADSLAKTSRATGVSVESLQKWEYVAGQSGVAADSMQNAIKQFASSMGQAERGMGRALPLLDKLGIQFRDVNGNIRDTEALMYDVVSASENLSKVEQLDIARQLFQNADFAVVLQNSVDDIKNLGNNMSDLGLITSKNAADSEVYIDSMDNLKRSFAGVGFEISTSLIPLLLDIIKSTTDWIKTNKEWISQNISGIIEGIVGAFQVLVSIIKDVFGAFGDLTDALNITGNTGLSVGEIIGNTFKNIAIIIRTVIEAIKVAFKSGILFIIHIFESLWNKIQIISVYIENVFKNPIKTILSLFNHLLVGILGIFSKIANVIARITGSETFKGIQQGIDNLQSSIAASIDFGNDAANERIKQLSREGAALEKAYLDSQKEIIISSAENIVETTYKLYGTDEAKKQLNEVSSAANATNIAVQNVANVQFNEVNFLKSLGLEDNKIKDIITNLNTLRGAQDKLSKETSNLASAQLGLQLLDSIGITDATTLLSATEQLALQREELERLKQVAEATGVPLEKLQEQLTKTGQSQDTLSASIKNFDFSALQAITFSDLLADSINAMGNNIANTISDVIAGNKSLADGFRDMTAKILTDISALIIKMLVFKAIMSSLQGLGFGTGGGLLGGLFGFSDGGLVGSSGARVGFADGGYTGDGGKYDVAGIVHKGEYVVPKNLVAPNIDVIRGLEAQRLGRRGFATGGPVATSIQSSKIVQPTAQANNNQQSNMKIIVVMDRDQLAEELANSQGFETRIVNIARRNKQEINS